MRPRELEPHHLEAANVIIGEISDFLEHTHEISYDPAAYPQGQIHILRGEKELDGYCRTCEKAWKGLEKKDRSRAACFSGEVHGNHRSVVYLPDAKVLEAVEGTFLDRRVFTEEMSHAYFLYSQIKRHGKKPCAAFVELVGALDVMNYQFQYNPDIGSPDIEKAVFDEALKGFDDEYLDGASEPHYYFAHKWAQMISNLLAILAKNSPPEAIQEILKRFYNGTDGDRLNMLLADMPAIYRMAQVPLSDFRAFDPGNARERALFTKIVEEVNDPRVRMQS